jgi:hypothetical protein
MNITTQSTIPTSLQRIYAGTQFVFLNNKNSLFDLTQFDAGTWYIQVSAMVGDPGISNLNKFYITEGISSAYLYEQTYDVSNGQGSFLITMSCVIQKQQNSTTLNAYMGPNPKSFNLIGIKLSDFKDPFNGN